MSIIVVFKKKEWVDYYSSLIFIAKLYFIIYLYMHIYIYIYNNVIIEHFLTIRKV